MFKRPPTTPHAVDVNDRENRTTFRVINVHGALDRRGPGLGSLFMAVCGQNDRQTREKVLGRLVFTARSRGPRRTHRGGQEDKKTATVISNRLFCFCLNVIMILKYLNARRPRRRHMWLT